MTVAECIQELRQTQGMMNQIVAQRLRELRQARGFSQAKLAELTGIHRPNICRLERGQHAISLGTLEKICKALDTNMSAVLEGL